MKKFLYIFAFACFLLAGCKESGKSDHKANGLSASIENADTFSDSVADEGFLDDDIVDADQAQNVASAHSETTKTKANEKFFVDKNGIGIIKVGENVKDLPAEYEGLYDQKKIVPNGSGSNVCLIYANKEQIMEIDYNNKTNKITSIRLTSPSIMTEDGIKQFMGYSSLLKMDKVRQAIGNKSKDDVFDFTIDGVRYELDENIKGDKYVSAIVVGK